MKTAPAAPTSPAAAPPAPAGTAGQWLAYLAVRMAAEALTRLPLGAATALAKTLARAWHFLDRRHRLRMEGALIRSLEVDAREAKRIARGVYPHFAAALVDFLRFPRMAPEEREACIAFDAQEVARLAELIRVRGAVFVTGHLGLWELGGAWAAWRGWIRAAIARPLKNPWLNAWVRRLREGLGQTIWDRGGALRLALRTLRRGECFALVADQDGGSGGAPVPFFGQASSTMAAAADLAVAGRAPVIVAAALREGPLRYRMVFTEPFAPDPDASDRTAERLRLLGEMNRRLEDLIRQAPEQWIWHHRRWRTAERWASGELAPPPGFRPAGAPESGAPRRRP